MQDSVQQRSSNRYQDRSHRKNRRDQNGDEFINARSSSRKYKQTSYDDSDDNALQDVVEENSEVNGYGESRHASRSNSRGTGNGKYSSRNSDDLYINDTTDQRTKNKHRTNSKGAHSKGGMDYEEDEYVNSGYRSRRLTYHESDDGYSHDEGDYGNSRHPQPDESVLSGSMQYDDSVLPSPPSHLEHNAGSTRRYSESGRSSRRSRNHAPTASLSGYDQNSAAEIESNAFGGDESGFWNPNVPDQMPANIQSPPAPTRKNLMNKFLSSFRLNKFKTPTAKQLTNETTTSGQTISARVIMLDGEEISINLNRDDLGQLLFDQVCQIIDIYEKDYFGLTYVSNKLQTWFWLDLQSKISKQLRDGEQWLFYFQVKFYPPEPTLLQEDITRYQLSLQIRQDIYTGKLPCSWVTQALLGSFMVQSELGDYDPQVHVGLDFLKEFEFVPQPTTQLLQKIAELYKTHVGMKPNQADIKYLETAKRLELYGVDLHPARDMENVEIYIGVGFHGVVIYRDRLRIGRFAWPKVLRISYKKSNFYLKIRPDYSEPVEAIVGFRLLNPHLANRLWKAAVEHHAFFRLKETPIRKRTIPAPVSLKSQYRYTGRTFFQYRTMNIDRPHPHFNRSIMKRRTASMPTGLNTGMYTLNRAHPRDMTVGRTQESDQFGSKRLGPSQLPSNSGNTLGRSYATVPRDSHISPPSISDSHGGAPSQLSRQYSDMGGSVAYSTNRSADHRNHEYINYRTPRPNDDESVMSGSAVSARSSQQGLRTSTRDKRYTPDRYNESEDDQSVVSPIYVNERIRTTRKYGEDDNASTVTDSSNHHGGTGRLGHEIRTNGVVKGPRKPPSGGVPVFGGVMLSPSSDHVRQSDRSRTPASSHSNRNNRHHSIESEEDPEIEDEPETVTEDVKQTTNSYRSHGQNHRTNQQYQTRIPASPPVDTRPVRDKPRHSNRSPPYTSPNASQAIWER